MHIKHLLLAVKSRKGSDEVIGRYKDPLVLMFRPRDLFPFILRPDQLGFAKHF